MIVHDVYVEFHDRQVYISICEVGGDNEIHTSVPASTWDEITANIARQRRRHWWQELRARLRRRIA